MCCPCCTNAIGAILTSMNLAVKEIQLVETVVEEPLGEEETELFFTKTLRSPQAGASWKATSVPAA